VACENENCRLHVDYEEDLNCTLVAVHQHGPLTLEEIGKRHQISTVRVKQILDATLVKLKKTLVKENTI
jgi:DNA-directed RNA polymerase sigma subunit (sigma70/sigma32)